MMTFNPVYVDTRQRLLELEAELSSKESMKARLEGLIKQKEQLLQEIPENQKQLNVLEQERDSARKIYEELLKRQGQAEVSKQMEIGDKTLNFRLVDPAITPKHPVSPNLQLFMLVAVLGGLAGAFGVALLLDGLGSSSIRSVNEIEDFDVEILGSIPYLDTKKERVKKNISRATVISIMSIYYLCVVGLFIYETYFRWEQ